MATTMAERRARKAERKKMPVLSHETIDREGASAHLVSCSCSEWFVETNDEGVARYAASTHFARHARQRIQPPEVEDGE
jgi:hypothetical protein